MSQKLYKEENAFQIGNQLLGAKQRESGQIVMPMAEKSRRADWGESLKQMGRVVATWSNSLSQLARANSKF